MALLNTTKTALFLQAGDILPVPPANFIETTAPVMVVPTVATTSFKRISGKLNTSDSYADVCNAQTSITVEHLMRSNDIGGLALDTPPEYGELLKICGFDETINAGTGVVYTNSQQNVLGSGVAFLDGHRFNFTKSLASDLVIELLVGSPAKITSTLTGYMDDIEPIEEAQPSVTLSEEPLMVVSCANLVLLDGSTLKPDRVTFATNPEIADFYTMGGADGLKGKVMSDYALTCTIDFFIDNDDYAREITAIKNQTYATLQVDVATDDASGLVDGKSMQITCDLVKTESFTDTDDSSVGKRSVSYRLANNASDIAMTIQLGLFT